MDLNPKTETFAPGEDHSWLGSAHGTEATETIQLDGSEFTGTWADGIVPSGVVLGQVTASGLYVPHDSTAGDGRETAVGMLFTTADVGDAGSEVDTPAALLTHGKVKVANLPANHGLDVSAAGQMEHIRFIGDLPADEA